MKRLQSKGGNETASLFKNYLRKTLSNKLINIDRKLSKPKDGNV